MKSLNTQRIINFFKKLNRPKHIFREETMTTEELITSKGYKLENHYIKTEDGFILRIFRFNTGVSELNNPVYFQHGLMDSCDGWICNEEDKSLSYYLAKQNYDIWLGNTRGNKYSRNHTSLSPKNKKFWDFSFSEMGMYDIPSVLDYIHNMNKKKIIYIGHSQGTIMLFSALTNKLDYFKTRLALFIALGPVALASKVESLLADYINRVEFENYANKYKYYEYGRMNDRLNKFILHRFPEISHKLMIAMSEKNLQDNNVEWLRVYLAHSPSGTSYKAMNHFKQIGLSNRFQEYDYSGPENVKRYNQSYPPEYDLKKIKDFPIALLAGENDKLCPIENVEWLRDQLGSNVVLYRMYKNMGHMTFLMPKNIDWFDDVMTVMKKYT